LIECQPLTGRTNQIRVALAHVGLPLAGDKLYGRSDKEFLDFFAVVKAGGDSRFDGRYECERHMLHAPAGIRASDQNGTLKIEAEIRKNMKLFIEKYS